MEKPKRQSKKRRKTRAFHTHNNNGFPNLTDSDFDSNTDFALLLAALCNLHKQSHSLSLLIRKCLTKFHASLHHILPNSPILSLLPILVSSKSAGIAYRGAEIVGAASLLSLEMNQRIAMDGETVKALVSALVHPKRRVILAACNAVLDLCTTSIGRHCLLDFSALEALIFRFLQVHMSPNSVSLCSVDSRRMTCTSIGFKGDEHPVLLLNAAINLINTCNIEQLEKIPRNLSVALLAFSKKLWAQVHSQMLLNNCMKFNQETDFYASNIKINNLAESIFRLSICADQLSIALPFEAIEMRIFGSKEAGFEDFMLNHWEASPFIMERLLGDSNDKYDIFGPFIQSLNSKESFPFFLSSMLQSMVSCLPIASDELDILSFLKEVQHKLGCPIIYQQDVRVLRMKMPLEREEHFFQFASKSCCLNDSQTFKLDDVLKCGEAYQAGYTIALRGMEFRFESIAAIADGLASLFGQPSVGVNMYLTPPNSQGLARHYDDHCVFVCQLLGTKKWKVFSKSNSQLPRLYDPIDSLHCPEAENSTAACTLFSLGEGDVLYIPRGFPHEACTNSGDGYSGFSLHLTFGIEVEPPFEWEGFVHVALNYWHKNQKPHYASDSSSGILYDISVDLLHVTIGLIADSDHTFRKASLAGAVSWHSYSNNRLEIQKTIFCDLLRKINTEPRFSEVVKSVEVAIQKNEDPFQRIKWLQFLNQKAETVERQDWNMPFMGPEYFSTLCGQDRDKGEAAFSLVKSRFCCEVKFDDVIGSYRMLLERYKKVRKQYTNGMISLHYGS
ncbi:hypothetical protein FEM48_Zijuj01G0018400 [Ziziphus jujuba var. spinosa]|uniref:Bifunctional lysine-specific demethylase and histidyl-hydroxylase n=1 Tax=Ziziphus jujuba var. spinosa TaxID=714518 RepID=A0A978VYF7_ZIZJJ|nr:hypothetical protein FEM48_Zijuj01G0018400 [Ziziphus jujuba var. spinosa]